MKYDIDIADILESKLGDSILNLEELEGIFRKIQWIKEDSKTGGLFEKLDFENIHDKIVNLKEGQIENFQKQISESTEAMIETDKNLKNKM